MKVAGGHVRNRWGKYPWPPPLNNSPGIGRQQIFHFPVALSLVQAYLPTKLPAQVDCQYVLDSGFK